MTDLEHLAEQHIRQHESHLKHIDELLGRARKGVAQQPEAGAEVEKLAEEREKLASDLDDLKQRDARDWEKEEIATAGPMGVWDAVAQALEKLVEKLER